MEETIVNKVASSGIITLNLEDHYHSGSRKVIDVKDVLFMGMILKEKEFREWIKTQDWTQYQNSNVAIICSADAIVPTWAYMLIASKLNGIANHYVFGNLQELESSLYQKSLASMDLNEYADKRVVIKGCGDKNVPESAYVEASRLLLPVVKSLMFGEPCSTVPVYKKQPV
ncbi:MAG: DUF2480 family protein [Bacteroidetes bacterium]|nr:DUF2480 family protein [Bacteroidota bacterium]